MERLLFVSSIAFAVCTAALAADAPTMDPSRLSADVKVLSSDTFEGREPATEGENKTVAYVTEQMKKAGLQPAGDLKNGKHGWTQAVPLLRAQIKGTPSMSISEGGRVRALTQGQEIAMRAAMDGSKQVSVKDAPLVFVGYGITAPEKHWDDFKDIDLHGKIAIVLINDPDFETGIGDFGGKAMTYYGRWTYKYEEAARRGALGVLIVHEIAPASYGWNTVKNSNTNTMFDVVRDHPESAHPKIEAWIQRDVAVDVFKRIGLNFNTLKKAAQARDFKPIVLKDVMFSADFAVDTQVITSHNVVGRVEGSKYPNQSVIYSAHWDHLGIGAPDEKGDRIYNGAVDNATGTAALLELARAFAHERKPERSVVFLHVTAEEKGLLGSEYYATKPLYPLAKTVGVINMDALDPHGIARNFSTSGSEGSDLLDLLQQDAKDAGMAYVSDPHPEAGHFFRSDHFSFAKRGVPALSFESGNDLVDGGIAAGEAEHKDYTVKRYHQPGDQWQADWSFTGMAHDLAVLYKVGSDLANSDRWPNWAQDSQFRAIRDASAAERR